MNLPWKTSNSTQKWDPVRFSSPASQLFDEIWNQFNFPTWSNFEVENNFSPKINVTETESQYKITAELPGLDEKDFEVLLEDNVLRIRGEKKTHEEHKDSKVKRFESTYGSFERAFELPNPVDAERVQAKYKNGVLFITLEKNKEVQKSHKIQIQTAQ